MRPVGRDERRTRGILGGLCLAAGTAAVSGCTAIITKQIYIGQAEQALRQEYSDNLSQSWTEGSVLERMELAQGQSAAFEVRVLSGEAVGVLAACDQDCSGLNLEIRDADGFPVDRVISGEDNRPFASVEPGPAHVYTAQITMAACADDPCFVSYWVMRTPSPEVRELVTYYQETLQSEWDAIGPTQRGALERLRTTEFPVDLLRGEDISIVAACDPDCVDLNIQVVDAEGFPLDQTIAGTERIPTSTFAVAATGTYQLRVGMAECTDDPCSFAYWILERRRGTDAQ